MPSNEQRRQAAKRKLERQLEHRAQRSRRRKQLTIGGSVVGVIAVVAAIALVVTLTAGDDEDVSTDASSETTSAEPPPAGALPAGRSEPLPELVNCTYVPDGAEPSRPVEPPRTEGIDTTVQTVSVSMETSQGNLGLILNNADSPCTVNNFLSLATKNFFNNTPCHRIVTEGIFVLQCGDPSGSGKGGPGYGFNNEFPTDQFDPADPQAGAPMIYPRGTLAMANSGAQGTNGSQFFLVYEDSQLPPNYTVFGTIDETGLATLDQIAAAGNDSANGPGDGAPTLPVEILTVRMD